MTSKVPFTFDQEAFSQPRLYQMAPLDTKADEQSEYDRRLNERHCYNEYIRIYTISYNLALEYENKFGFFEGMRRRIHSVEEKMNEIRRGPQPVPKKELISEENRKKRSRRTAEEIEKKYKCQIVVCERLYGSEGSLQQHIKLKHPQLYRKEEGEDDLASHSRVC